MTLFGHGALLEEYDPYVCRKTETVKKEVLIVPHCFTAVHLVYHVAGADFDEKCPNRFLGVLGGVRKPAWMVNSSPVSSYMTLR